MNDYKILAIASDVERSAALLEEAATTFENRGVMEARGAFLVYMAGVLLHIELKKMREVIKDDDIL